MPAHICDRPTAIHSSDCPACAAIIARVEAGFIGGTPNDR